MGLGLKAGLGMRQGQSQSLVMTAELHQYIRLLSLSHHELQAAFQDELLKNPLLEEVIPEGGGLPAEGFSEASGSEGRGLQESHGEAGILDRFQGEPPQREFDQREALDSLKSAEALGYENSPPAAAAESFAPQPVTFQSRLLWQAQVSSVTDQEKFILAVLISHLDERGYLAAPLEELAENEKIPLARMEEALLFLLSLDPPGSGARSLEECLLAQARLIKEPPPSLVPVIRDHLKNLQKRNYQIIARSLQISEGEVKACCRAIQAMEPEPARNFSPQPVVYAAPDIYIVRDGSGYKAALNEEGIPRLRFSSSYLELLRSRFRCSEEAKQFLQGKKREGAGFLQAARLRGETILKMGQSLIKFQAAFFDRGIFALKPLTMDELARDISASVSTVSRIAANKYAQTPQGLILMKNFFSQGILSETGEDVSLTVIKACIQDWINREGGELRPMSDKVLARQLSERFSISLSRRTAAAYRASLGIPPLAVRQRENAARPSWKNGLRGRFF